MAYGQASKMTLFNEAVGMLIQSNPLKLDWEYYFEAAQGIGLNRLKAQEYLEDFKRECGLLTR